MAMSSLSAQLAGLSGQTQPTNRRREDAIGRGIAHSTQVGYSLHASSSKYKPSVLYEDAKAASDVPLTTLRENALSSLNQLTRVTGSEAFVSTDYIGLLMGKTSVSWERRVSSKSDVAQRDKLCEKLLGLLCTVWGEDENSDVINQARTVSDISGGVTAFAAGLHVMEYLLRLYSVHLHLAEALVLCVLPAHETPLFNRVLQLIDLAEMPSYIFLRPFAAPGAETMPRGTISKKVAGDDALIASLCKLAKDAARIHSADVPTSSADEEAGIGPVQPRQGVSRIISFAAAVLVEALDIQTTAVTSAGSAKESTLRVILPYVLGACCGNEKVKGARTGDGKTSLSIICPDFRSWGYVMASALVAKCPAIAPEVREVIATKISKGALEMAICLGHASQSHGDFDDEQELSADADSASVEAVEEMTTSMLALLSVLSRDSLEEKGQLASLPRVSNTGASRHHDLIGLNMPVSTFRPLAKLSHLTPSAFGAIMDSQDLDITGALASLFVRSFEYLLPTKNQNAGKKSTKKIGARRGESLRLILAMLKESSLKEVWTNRSNGLTSSVSSHVVVSFASSSFNLDDADSEVNDFLGNCRLILRNLRSVDAVGCDAGIAHAVALLKGGKKKRRKEAARRIELLIGTQAPASANPTGEAQRSEPLNQDDKSSSPAAASDEFARLLPARVALEHPDASIRLHAVKRLLDDVETAASTEADGESSPEFDSDDAVDVGRSLLRRFLADDDSGVAAAAAGAIRRLVAEDIVREEDIFGDAESIYSVISGLLKWSVLDDIPSKASLLLDVTDIDQDLTEYDKCADKLEGQPPADPIEAMCCALALAGLAASTLLNAIDDEDVFSQAIESEGELLRILLIYICAHLDITSDGLDEEKCIDACQVIHDAAASALIHAIAEDIEEESDSICDIQEKASQLICDNENCLAVLLRTCSGHTPDSVDVGQIEIDKNMERRYMWACLHCMCKGILGDGDQEEENGEEYGIGGSLEQNILTVINHILEISGEKDSLTDREAAALLGHLVPCFASIINNNPTMLPAALIDLCTSTSTTAYDKVSKPAILYLFGVTDVNDEGGGSAGATNLSPVAILLEAASRHGVEEIAITRLVSIACMSMSKDNILSRQQNIVNGLVQALSLLSHSSQSVRASAIEFISNVDSLGSKNMPTICEHLPDAIESLKSSLMMDGGALPNFLMEIVTGSNSAKEARDDLLKHCVVAAIGTTSRVDEGFSFGDYLGGSFSTYKIFNAMNQARESVFPLTERWDRAGHAVFNAFTSSDVDVFSDRYADVEMHPIMSLCEIVVLMCKGVISSKNSAPSVVISTGPAKSGRRARSYSVGAGDDGGLLIIDPYPETMSSALSEFLSGAPERIGEPYVRLMYNTIAHCILCSQTWGERIFPRLKVDARRTIASALLQLRSQREIESAGASLSNLQINESDMCHLFESEFARGSLALTCVADCIRSRAAALAGSTSALNLSALLFDKLKSLSGEPSSDGGYEYVRLSLLQALISLHGEMTKQNVSLPKKSKSARKKGSRARSQSDAAVEKFAEQATVLVALVGSEKATLGSSEVHPVRSSRGRAMVLSLLTTLCSQAPGAVVGSLIPALGNILSPSSTGNETNSLAANQALRAVVPAYCTHAAASGFSFAELIDAFIASCYTNSTRSSQRSELCTSFADALVAVETSQGHGQGIASFVGSLVAADAAALLDPAQESDNENAMDADSNDGMEEDSPDAVALSIEVLGRASTTDQVVASLQIVQYVGQMIELLGRSSDSNTNFLASALDKTSPMKKQRGGDSSGLSYVIDTHDLYRRAVAEREDRDNYKKALISLTTNLLYVIRDLYSFSSIKKVIKNNEGKLLNNVCLSLWQELVQLQSNSLRYQAVVFAGARSSDNELLRDEKEFWEGVPGAAEECLDLLQRVLPVPDYLASVTNLLQDDDTEAPLFVRTAELLSERAAEIDPYSHEATLFLEVVPELVTILRRSESDDTREDAASRRQVTIKQASLMAIERLAQALCLATGDERVFKKGSSVLLPAMKEVTVLIAFQSDNLINLTNSSSSSQIETNDGEIQLLSTAALCASTLLAVLRARCLPLLAKLVKPVISSLTSINVWLMNCNAKHRKSANLSQLALLRTLVSVAETLPQFAVPYLGILFAPSALPSRMLRSNGYEDNVIVANMTERLDRALAKRTPARQIIPAASKAVGLCLNKGDNANNSDADADDGGDAAGWQEAKALLSILKSSVECTSRAELTPVVGKLLNSILIAFKYDDDEEGQQELLAAANETLLALVLKLSEAQLRPLYARIREWRGDLDGTSREGDDDAEEAATKRYAFWSMSALLSKELRSIFLPCLSSVLSDAIKELEFAVNKLCTPDLFSKKDGGKKRRRLGDSGEGSISPSSLRPLQPILLCLESALKADAHEGGSWIRGDDGQRHALILEPLGKLLQAKLPSDLLVATNRGESTSTAISPYESLIQGIGTLDHGSVSRCIVALAMAAGDERMWKPINHALLQACENSDRAEVRRAGVHCLKSVMESIGEEYMVLLPECLPALSELLEDEDEEIAGLARECVTLGEELLGESLEDSLR